MQAGEARRTPEAGSMPPPPPRAPPPPLMLPDPDQMLALAVNGAGLAASSAVVAPTGSLGHAMHVRGP